MPIFTYNAHDLNGKSVTGSVTGINEQTIRRQLRQNGLFVTRIRVEKPVSSSRFLFLRERVSLYDLVIFSRQLATLVRAGLGLTDAFTTLTEQTRNETLHRIIQEMHADILGGSTFSDAIQKHDRIFSELYRALVAAGEEGGILAQTLDTAAEALDKEMEIREKVRSAFVYPMAVLITAVGVVSFLLIFVVPIFAGVYRQFHAKLPQVTQMLIDISGFLRTYWWLLGAVVAIVIFAAIRFNQTYSGRRFFDALRIRLPLLGPLIEKVGLARMTHTLSALTSSGVPLVSGLITAGSVSNSSLVMDALRYVILAVEKGGELGESMTETRRFPAIMTRMITAGERSGNLPEMLSQIGRFFDRDVEYGIKRLMTLIEPILTVVMGIVVGFILLALYLPIFNLGNIVRNP